jgi:hypothetical protein
MADLLIYGVLAVILVFVFFAYLMIRRTVTGFKEGMENSNRK